MKQKEAKFNVLWEEVTTDDRAQRLAAAFEMLLAEDPITAPPADEPLDSNSNRDNDLL